MPAVFPVQGCSNKLVALLKRKICLVDRETGSIPTAGLIKATVLHRDVVFVLGSVLEVLATVQDDKPGNRFNDAKCDCSGRLWCGTMGAMTAPGVLEPKQGILFSYSAGEFPLLVVQGALLSDLLDFQVLAAKNDRMHRPKIKNWPCAVPLFAKLQIPSTDHRTLTTFHFIFLLLEFTREYLQQYLDNSYNFSDNTINDHKRLCDQICVFLLECSK